MATKTSTSKNTSISQNGEVYTVKEVTTKTTTSPGKEPVVETTETVNEYKGKHNLPEHIRQQVEKKQVDGPINMNATRGNFAQDVLNEINKFRSAHGVDALKLSPELMKHCEDQAKKMADLDDMQNTDDNYGTTVTCMSSNDPEFHVKADAVVGRWYFGSQGYDYTKEPKELTAGHFTQMIWKASKELGVAAAKSKTNQIYITSCFNPRGNYVNKFVENVRPPVPKGERSFLTASKRAFLDMFDIKKRKESREEMSQFNKDGLESHNKHRKRHGVPPLKYSKELADYAAEWARELARRDAFEHRTEGKYGENLYYSYNSDPNVVATASEACDSWYDEIQYYVFGEEPNTMKTGHFTQVVWRETKEVGMGMARSKTGRQYVVANYHPPGNYIGMYKDNVPKPLW